MSSSPEQVRRDGLKTLFAEALQLPPDQRPEFLNANCGEDVALQGELMSLLEAHGDASVYFDALAGIVVPREPLSGPRLRDPSHVRGLQVSDYEVLEVLGGGGMGVVYKARHRSLDRLAALKFLPPHLSADSESKVRFLQEARIAATLDHPHICTIYDVGEAESGQLFIAMAYYEGETLKAKLSEGPLDVEEAMRLGRQIADGLAKAHSCGVVHRDIKPANIIVTPDGDVKLLDFGLAKVADTTLTRHGAALGTVAYMSPEQASGEAVDHQADLWALGVVLYEMLTGERPFRGDHEQAVVHALLHSRPVPIREVESRVPRDVESVVNKCLTRDKSDRYSSAADLLVDLERVRGRPDAFSVAPVRRIARPASIFICYRRGADADERVAEAIHEALCTDHQVFFERDQQVGSKTFERLESEIVQSDYVILLLSEQALHSEMVLAEIEAAHHLARRDGGPLILPVRLAYWQPVAYPASAYLDNLQWAYWEGEEDTERLVSELVGVISGSLSSFSRPSSARASLNSGKLLVEPRTAAQPRLEMPEGTMDPHSAFYVPRPEDAVALRAVVQHGITVTIKGPRQMGKSSLLMRMMSTAADYGKEVVFLDFQLVDRSSLDDADVFFRQFCFWITDELGIEDRIDEYWKMPLSNGQRCTRYLGRHVLKAIGKPLLLAMDEVERVFDTSFRSDFFSMLRSWHNDRAIKPLWKGLDLALVTSTEPYQLIENLNQSPFNVGEVIALTEFGRDSVEELNTRHGGLLSGEQMGRLMDLIGGHPYLIRRAMYLIADGRITIDELLSTATDEQGPFGDHLRYHLFRLHRQNDLIEGIRQVLGDHRCDDEGIFWRLRGAGLVRRSGREVVMRCRLYADYLRTHLHD